MRHEAPAGCLPRTAPDRRFLAFPTVEIYTSADSRSARLCRTSGSSSRTVAATSPAATVVTSPDGVSRCRSGSVFPTLLYSAPAH